MQMTIQEAIAARHSVRAYKEQPLTEDVVKALEEKIAELTSDGNLHMQLILNEPKAFQGTLAKYGKFRGVNNYIVVAGISSGMYVSIISKSTPLAQEPFALSHHMTAKSLGEIGNIGGPRCCKRDSYLSILSAIDFTKEKFGVEMEKPDIVCDYSNKNNQCIGKRCPFFKTKSE
jgi:hypothetical protein